MAFEDHRAWIVSLREQRRSQLEEAQSQSHRLSIGSSSEHGGGPGAANVAVGVLLGQGGEGGPETSSAAGDYLGAYDLIGDDDFEEITYRSLGSIFSTNHEPEDDFEVGHDPEVDPFRTPTCATDDFQMGDFQPDEAWLATMPPLVHRQRARSLC